MCNINTTLADRQVSWVGDDIQDTYIRQYSDADVAGDPRTQRSASSSNQKIWGPNTRANQSMKSGRQTAVSHSTLESEIIAADAAVRSELLPAISLWTVLMGGTPPRCEILEGNQALCRVCKLGSSQNLKHSPRTHRIDMAAVTEQFPAARRSWSIIPLRIRPPTSAPNGLQNPCHG